MRHRLASVIAICLAAGSPAGAQTVRYDGYRAVRVTVANARELMTVRALAHDILTCEGSGIGTFDICIAPERYAVLEASGVRHVVLTPDMQAHVDQIWRDDAAIRAGDDPAWFATYRSTTEITSRLQVLAGSYPGLASYSVVGTSLLGVPIPMIRITGPGSTANRPAIVMIACQHAREWVTPMVAMYAADRLLELYSADSRIRNIVNRVDTYIVPLVNPDGYDYSRSGDNLWRKNRRPGLCVGVDLNRNWGFQWGFNNNGSSPFECDETYRGPSAFSEVELAGLKTLIDGLAAEHRLASLWDIHSSAQKFMSSWGYTTSAPPDLPMMNQVGQLVTSGISAAGGGTYPYGQSSVILYLANGVTPDYVYGVHGKPAWTLEIGSGGFQPPVSNILPTSATCFAGFLPFAEYFTTSVPTCAANCDGSTASPLLTGNDFLCFMSAYAAGASLANCDGSTTLPTLTPNDFQCFMNAYAAGCS